MDINYHVAVIGCGQLGGRLAKELCRFFESLKESAVRKVVLFDRAKVAEDDLTGQEYLPEDIGWQKAGVLSGVLKEAFPHVPVRGYGELTRAEQLSGVMGLHNVYDAPSRVAVIFDMSNGDRGVAGVCRKFFKEYINCIIVTPASGRIHTAVKLAGTVMSRPMVSARKASYKTAEAGRLVRLCLTKMAILVSEGRMENGDLHLSSDTLGVLDNDQIRFLKQKKTAVLFAKADEPLLAVVVGCGGTGGNFVKEFAKNEMGEERIRLLLIDGDRVEKKNLSRQPFQKTDILQNKAECLKEDLAAMLPPLEGHIFSYPFYLDCVEDLAEAVALTGHKGKLLLVGAVDNHRARQVLEEYYHLCADIVYVDAANEWSNGEVVVSVKKRGKELSPLRSFFYPDVLTDKGKSASELSCGAINESAPQHLCTNLASAQGVLGALSPVIHGGRVRGGIFYFDVFKEYARFQEVWCADFS